MGVDILNDWMSENGKIRKELQRGCLGVHGGVKETVAQARPQERGSTPSTPVQASYGFCQLLFTFRVVLPTVL